MKHKLLIVDDEPMTRKALLRILGSRYDCLSAADAESALKLFDENSDIAVVLTDYKMESGMNGVELITEVKRRKKSVGCILITAFGEIELAVNAMKQGADDFLTKPITDLNQLEVRIEKAISKGDLERKVEELKEKLDGKKSLNGFIGSSPAMENIYRLIRQVAPSNATVLIQGPSGTGKELTARAIHNLSGRADGPFVAVECSALSESILETELFGSVKGAYTDAQDRIGRFEAANGGTLFLDEIGEIPLSVQVKLLRALESRTIQKVGDFKDIPVNFRLVTATNKNLLELVKEGKFREDLYYRLNVIEIKTPPLKDHPEDIAVLAVRFMQEFAKAYSSKVKAISPEVVSALEKRRWPGNVRQLRNLIERMVVLASSETITISDLPPEEISDGNPIAAPEHVKPEKPREEQIDAARSSNVSSLAQCEKEQILSALEECGGNKSKAAEALGISRRTIHRKLKEWGIN
jgi:DNA-binding NtrC family response regulator